MTLQGLKETIYSIQRSSFVRNVTVLATGSAIAQIIPVIVLPLISRLYTPADFGIATLFLSISMIVGVSASLRYDHAIVIAKDTSTANRLVAIAVRLAIIAFIFLVILVVVVLVTDHTPEWADPFGVWFYFLPFYVLLIALDNTILGLVTREKQFRLIANATVMQSAIVSGIRVISGFFNGSISGLIGSLFAGMIARLTYLWLPKKGNLREYTCIDNTKEARTLMHDYRQFPCYSLPTGLLKNLNQYLPVFALAILFDPAVVGLYAIGNRLLRMPIQLFTESVRRTYLQKAAELVNQGETLYLPLLKVTGGLTLLGLVIFTPILLFGDVLFSFVLGEKWMYAGVFAQILSPLLFFLFLQGPSGATYVALQQQHVLVKIHLLSTLLIIGVFLVSFIRNYDPSTTLVLFSVVGSLMSITLIVIAIRLSTNNADQKPPVKPIL